MNIFIAWSGERSKTIATTLRAWLPNTIQAVKPWLSEEDINKGSRWQLELARKLEESRFGIICLTPENMRSPWLLYETGALSKTIEGTYVMTLLYDLEPIDLIDPYTMFQHTTFEKEEFRRLVKTMNYCLGDSALSEAGIDSSFNKWWPDIETSLSNLTLPDKTSKSSKSQEEVLEEILVTVRHLRFMSPFTDANQIFFALLGLPIIRAAIEELIESIASASTYLSDGIVSLSGHESSSLFHDAQDVLLTSKKQASNVHKYLLDVFEEIGKVGKKDHPMPPPLPPSKVD